MPRSNRPEQTRTNAIRSRCAGSMLACTLNTSPENGVSSGRGLALGVLAARRAAGARSTSVEQPAHAEVRQRRAEQHRASSRRPGSPSGRGRRRRRRAASMLLLRAASTVAPRSAAAARGHDPSPGPRRRRPGCACSGRTRRSRRSTTPRKSPATPTGQVTGVGRRPILSSISSSSSSGLAAGPVPLVDERDHRDAAGAADLEQLQRLRLHALGRVEQHDRAVDRGQHPVGVLGEVGVAGRVEQVDHVVAVVEPQRGRGDRDAALLLHLHPVRRRRRAGPPCRAPRPPG